jgi:hypothetical protein
MTEKSGPPAPEDPARPAIRNDWLIQETDDGMQVVPLQDLRDHIFDPTCWCNPTLDDGVWVHHSMDLREEYERGRKPS